MKEKITFEAKKAQEFFLNEISFMTGPFELEKMIKEKINEINVVDVRKYDDYIEGHIPFAIHLPFESLEDELIMLEKEKVNIVYCYNNYCKLGAKAAYKIAKKGFPVMVLQGGFHVWKKLGFDIVKTGSNTDM